MRKNFMFLYLINDVLETRRNYQSLSWSFSLNSRTLINFVGFEVLKAVVMKKKSPPQVLVYSFWSVTLGKHYKLIWQHRQVWLKHIFTWMPLHVSVKLWPSSEGTTKCSFLNMLLCLLRMVIFLPKHVRAFMYIYVWVTLDGVVRWIYSVTSNFSDITPCILQDGYCSKPQ
jgi:hypothetical protein